MKTLKACAVCALFILCSFVNYAQTAPAVAEPDYNKPQAFTSLPQSISINPRSLENLFSFSEGQSINIPLGSFSFAGVVVSKSDPADNTILSVVIRSTNFTNTAFTFTRIIDRNNNFLYRGRILSYQYSDAYELQEKNGQYLLTKTHHLKLINE